ncbi:MAG: CIA30 family protein [Candidatus Aminicenantes bacterium]|jgi:hypothetical protein
MAEKKNALYRIWRMITIFLMIYHPLLVFGKNHPFIDSMMYGQSESLLIDDFSGSNGISSLGRQWRMFTDRVMGGVSTADWAYETIDGRRCVRLRGDVSLANNGGFVQIALPLTEEGRPFDASAFKGVRLWAYGNGETYHIHLRSTDNRRPWQYYGAKFIADSSWRMVELPFSDFYPESLRAELKTDQLVRIAVVAIGREFKADIAVERLEFYR